MLLAALLVGMTSLLAGTATSANAQPGTVTKVEFKNQEFTDGSRQQIDVDWAVQGTAQAPVTVSIALPEGLQGYADRFDMLGDDGSKAGECVVTAAAINCTVDDQYVADHPQNMKGSFFFWVDVRLGNDEAVEHDFDFGDVSTTVKVNPTPDNTCTDKCDWTGQGGWKGGWISDLEKDEITWQVGVPAPADGIEAGKTIKVTDHLDTDVYELLEGPVVREARSVYTDGNGREQLRHETRTDGLTVSDDKLTVEFESAAGLGADAPEGQRGLAGSVYLVQWKVKVKDGIENNVEYTNTAEWTIEGLEPGQGAGKVVRQGGGGSVVGENEGKFTLKKELSGNTTLSPEFTVKYTVDGEPQDDIKISADGTFTSDVLPAGSKITLEEVKPTDPSNVSWKDPVFVVDGEETDKVDLTFSKENGNLGKVTEIRLKNEANLKTASIPASKEIVNDGDVVLRDGLEFTLDYAWNADEAKGIPAGEGSVTLPGNGDEVDIDNLPVGAEVSFTERAPAEVPGGVWEQAQISPDKVIVGKDDGVKVKVTNTITAKVGDFSVKKLIEGDGAALVPDDATFTVEYEYPAGEGFKAGSGELEVPADGTVEKSGPLPAGANVTVTEVTPGEVAGGTWGQPVFSPKSFTIEEGKTVGVDLTNTISKDLGAFSVKKLIEGDAASSVPGDATFTVEYEYPAGPGYEAGSGELVVPADGTVVSSDPLPAGAEVALTEATPGEVAGATWGDPKFSADTVTIGKDETVEVSLTNTITKKPSDTPKKDDKPDDKKKVGKDSPDGDLPGTGAEVSPLAIAVALALLIAGGATVDMLRRRS